MGAERIWRALDVIRQRGMCKGELIDNEGRVCAFGALYVSGCEEAVYEVRDVIQGGYLEMGADMRKLAQTASELFPERVNDRTQDIVSFNNHPDTTQEELELVFEKTAIKMDEVLGLP